MADGKKEVWTSLLWLLNPRLEEKWTFEVSMTENGFLHLKFSRFGIKAPKDYGYKSGI